MNNRSARRLMGMTHKASNRLTMQYDTDTDRFMPIKKKGKYAMKNKYWHYISSSFDAM